MTPPAQPAPARRARRAWRLLPATAAAGLLLGVVVGGLGLASVSLLDRSPDRQLALALLAVPVAVLGLVGLVSGAALTGLLTRLRRHALQDPDVRPSRRLTRTAEVQAAFDAVAAVQLRAAVAEQSSLTHHRTARSATSGVSELVSAWVAAEEGARGQLSAELHDTVAQTLARALSRLGPRPLAGAELVELRELVSEAEDEVRGLMARTRPPALRDGDLAAACSSMCDDLERRYGLQVELSWPEHQQPLPLGVAVTVYRFFQEGLLNVVKHAETDAASARLALRGHALVAEVEDRGPGFDVHAPHAVRGRHVGLGLLAERARLAGGALDVRSALGEGTRLRLTLDVPEAPAAAEPGATPVAAAR